MVGGRRGRWRESRAWSGGGESEDAGCGNRVGVDVEFSYRGDVTWDGEGATHDDDFFDAEEGVGVSLCGYGEIRQGPDGDDGDGVGWVVAEEAEDLLVRRNVTGRKERAGA